MEAITYSPQHLWCAAYVHAWAELSKGAYDPHVAWDDAGEAYQTQRDRNPNLVAAEDWAKAIS